MYFGSVGRYSVAVESICKTQVGTTTFYGLDFVKSIQIRIMGSGGYASEKII